MNTSPRRDNSLECNAEEAKIWLHTVNSAGTKKLVLSPDTHVYHYIGLPVAASSNIDVLAQLSKFNSV